MTPAARRLPQLARRPVFWWHAALAAAALATYFATRTPLARAFPPLDLVALPEIAGWSTAAARWVLAAAVLAALCGRGTAGLALGGLALGILGAVLAEWSRDALDLLEMQRELDPEFAAMPAGELIRPAVGAWWLGVGAMLWLACLIFAAAVPARLRRGGG